MFEFHIWSHYKQRKCSIMWCQRRKKKRCARWRSHKKCSVLSINRWCWRCVFFLPCFGKHFRSNSMGLIESFLGRWFEIKMAHRRFCIISNGIRALAFLCSNIIHVHKLCKRKFCSLCKYFCTILTFVLFQCSDIYISMVISLLLLSVLQFCELYSHFYF